MGSMSLGWACGISGICAVASGREMGMYICMYSVHIVSKVGPKYSAINKGG